MLVTITGRIARTGPSSAVVDVGGVGLDVRLSDTHACALDVGADVTLSTRLRVGRDMKEVCGFVTDTHCSLYDELVGVRGVGTGLALAVLGHLTPDQLTATTIRGSLPELLRVPGVGRRTAERIVAALAGPTGAR